MGGFGSGGRRLRPGPRPGTPKPGRQTAPAAETTRERVRPPASLAPAERATWKRLAPFAHGAGTLVPQTADAFAILVKLRVLVDEMAAQIRAEGFSFTKQVFADGEWNPEPRAHPLLNQHRNTVQRLQSLYAAFALTPEGRAMPRPLQRDAAARARAAVVARFFPGRANQDGIV